MSAAIAIPGKTAATFLVHFFGPGLADSRYVVERFRTLADGDIRRCPDPAPKRGRTRRAKAVTATLKEMRPGPDEIIVCTGLGSRGGVQCWGSYVAQLGMLRRLRSL